METAYSAAKETEIRSETVLAASYDPVSRPKSQTHVKAGLNVLAIDELVSFSSHKTVMWSEITIICVLIHVIVLLYRLYKSYGLYIYLKILLLFKLKSNMKIYCI